MKIVIDVASVRHISFAHTICEMMYDSALKRGTGIARRSEDYIIEKMISGKAVIAIDVTAGVVVGFSYIETWGHQRFVANSGLIVNTDYRNIGIAKKIKQAVFNISRKLYPEAKIFSITTGLAVMKMNTELGFKPVPFSELTDDPEFWQGCRGCKNYDVLARNNFSLCLCTGLLYDPAEERQQLLDKAAKLGLNPVIENVI